MPRPGGASGRRHIASTLGFAIAVAAKTAVFIIVTARGCFTEAEPGSASAPGSQART